MEASDGPAATHPTYPPTLGARYLGDNTCRFRVWAPKADRLELKIVAPTERRIVVPRCESGYYEAVVDDVPPDARYFYRLDGERDRPDPASRWQPDGVHRASAVVDPEFDWHDEGWAGLALRDYLTYELHVGTFTPEGTFDAVTRRLDSLKDLGVTAVELMPVAQFPGERNWGYDGVHPFAVQNTYGGPDGLKRLVGACHRRGLAVVLDVVYNHIGPEGNYLAEFGPYFTNRHRTPWGMAVNFDDRMSDEVRRFFIENALYWIDEFHIDALRLDAVHAIFDFSARPFLQELADAVRLEGERLGRRVFTVAESSLNDSRLIRPKEQGGLGIDAQWCDDLHHALRSTLTGEKTGYYEDFHGFEDLVKAYREGYVLDGRYSAYRGRRHGNWAGDVPPERFVVCCQNHDQVGNRMLGERLGELVSFEQLKLAAAVVILSPYQPLLFMGEEYGETARFQYFISHGDPDLIEATRRGRVEEFARFRWTEEPLDPQDTATFERSKLNYDLRHEDRHRVLREFYKSLIGLRRTEPALAFADRGRCETYPIPPGQVMVTVRRAAGREVFAVFNFDAEPRSVTLAAGGGRWSTLLDSAETTWQGPGGAITELVTPPGQFTCRLAANSVAVFSRSGA